MVCSLLDDVLSFNKIVRQQLTVVVLEVSQQVLHEVVDGFFHAIADIHKIQFLDCGNDLFHKSLLNSCKFSKQTHFVGVRNSHSRIIGGVFDIRDDERTRVSWVDEGSG